MSTELKNIPRSWAGDVYVGSPSLGAGSVVAANIGAGAVLGVSASQPLRTKAISSVLPTIATTGAEEVLLQMPYAGTIIGIDFVFKDALAQHATNIVTFTVVNHGHVDGTGSTAVLAVSDSNTTKTTTGIGIVAYAQRGTALAVAANLIVAQSDILAIVVTASGTLANALTEGNVVVYLDIPS